MEVSGQLCLLSKMASSTLCFTSSFVPWKKPVTLTSRHVATSRNGILVPVMSMRRGGTGWTPRRFSKNFGGSSGAGGGGAGGDGNAGGGVGGGQGGGGGGYSSGSSDKSSNPLLAFWRAYNASLESNPILTKALTSLVGFFLGDLLAQKFLGDKDAALDGWRLARMAAFGFMFHGPTGHYFYNALDRLLVGKSPLIVGSKVFIDQVCWAPIFTVFFFGFLGLAERKSVDEITQKIKGDTWAGVTASWKVSHHSTQSIIEFHVLTCL